MDEKLREMMLVWLITYGREWIPMNNQKFVTPMDDIWEDLIQRDRRTYDSKGLVSNGWIDVRRHGDASKYYLYRLSDKTIKELNDG
jgi:hypothetical protein